MLSLRLDILIAYTLRVPPLGLVLTGSIYAVHPVLDVAVAVATG